MILIVCRLIVFILVISSMKKGINFKVGANIRKIRLSLRLSQEQLAEIADLHRTYIGGIERGERNITLVVLEKIAKALKVKPKDLLED